MEQRTRVTIHLVCNGNIADMRVCNRILAYLQEQQTAEARVLGFTTSTLTGLDAFEGFWYSSGEWKNDRIILVMIDFEHPKGKLDEKLGEALLKLKSKISEEYSKSENPQEEIWIVTHPILRLDETQAAFGA